MLSSSSTFQMACKTLSHDTDAIFSYADLVCPDLDLHIVRSMILRMFSILYKYLVHIPIYYIIRVYQDLLVYHTCSTIIIAWEAFAGLGFAATTFQSQ